MFRSVFDAGVIGKASQKKELQISFHNLREYTTDKHQSVDDIPYGGGGGLIFKIEPLVRALRSIQDSRFKSRSILLTPRGKMLSSETAKELSEVEQLILFCGRYEGVDERFSEYIDDEISIGDYILTGGEIPAMIVIDAVSRFVPGVVGQEEAPYQDSFSFERNGYLEHPSYTRPRIFEGKEVPQILLSGHHAEVEKWRKEMARDITLQRRPDLLKKFELFEKE